MKQIINYAIYYRKPTAEELASGMPKKKKIYIGAPVKDVFLGVTDTCGAVLKPTVKGEDGLRYYFECVNLAEVL